MAMVGIGFKSRWQKIRTALSIDLIRVIPAR